MGGFMLYRDKTPFRALQLGELDGYIERNRILITEKEIEDRSRGDALLKGFVALQTSWFVLQCLARGMRGLAVTQLELVTLAFVALNLVTYGLWWEKPFNISCPFPIYMDHAAPAPIPTTEPEYDIHDRTHRPIGSNLEKREEPGTGGEGRVRSWLRHKPVELLRLAITHIRSLPAHGPSNFQRIRNNFSAYIFCFCDWNVCTGVSYISTSTSNDCAVPCSVWSPPHVDFISSNIFVCSRSSYVTD
jgi:hypothetical protein